MNNRDKKETQRAFGVKVTIIVFFVIILSLWLANLRNVFAIQDQAAPDETWQKIDQEIKNIGAKNQAATTTPNISENRFVQGMLNKANDTAALTEEKNMTGRLSDILDQAATTTASSSVATCPKKIDCRPLAGKAKSCVIPVGCEGITQIVH
jgi:hypothetical protein